MTMLLKEFLRLIHLRFNSLQHLLHLLIFSGPRAPPAKDVGSGEDGVPEPLELAGGDIVVIIFENAQIKTDLGPAVGTVNAANDKSIDCFSGPSASRGIVVKLAGLGRVAGWLILGKTRRSNCDHDV